MFNLTFLSKIIIYLFINQVLSCDEYYKIKKNDTCLLISKKYGISLEELSKLNKDINCENLQQTKICVSKSSIKRSLIDSCTKTYEIEAGDTCYKIWLENRLPERLFYYLNPNIDCQNLRIGSLVCIDDGLTGCVEYYNTNKTDTCKGIGDAYDFDVESLEVNNPGLNCSNLVEDTNICILFRNPNCSFVYYINNRDSFISLMKNYSVDMKLLYLYNPYLRSGNLQVFQGICLNSSFTLTTKKHETYSGHRYNLIIELAVCIPIVLLVIILIIFVFLR